MTGPILFINPNSSRKVTDSIAQAVRPFASAWDAGFECLTLDDGPSTIATDLDVAQAGLALSRLVQERSDAAAYVVGCFSDPGLETMRSLTDKPVLGLQQAGVLAAMSRADQFGIISLGPSAKVRHRLMLRQAGVSQRFVGSVDLGGASAESVGYDPDTFEKSCAAGRRLVEMGADIVVLGCAGFAPQRRKIEAAVGVPVIDPVLAAAGLALAACH